LSKKETDKTLEEEETKRQPIFSLNSEEFVVHQNEGERCGRENKSSERSREGGTGQK